MRQNFFLALLLCSVAAIAQGPATVASPATPSASVSRTTKAVNYRHTGGSTKIDFHGTELLQQGSGEAKVDNKGSRTEIEAKFDNMEDATKFGLEYLTYVLWAISPQGRAVNLGEVVLKNGSGKVKAITDMETFGMIVTAEPYFAVTQPGNMVVIENVLRSDTKGQAENIEARFELIGRGAYSSTNTRIDGAIFGIDRKTPVELFEARNAVRIAHIAMAEKYAAPTIAKAEQQLLQAESVYRRGQDRKVVEAAARDVVETAEEARVMSVKRKAEEDTQLKAAADKKAAEDQALAEAKRRLEAEQARVQAEAARAEAERMKAEAQLAAAQAAKATQEAEQARAAALAQQQALAAEAEKARALAAQADQARQQAEREKQDLRAQLLQQLNSILATRDTARGLIASMGDVLFRSGSYELRPEARERLAKVSGILLAHPGLHVDIEGHTDSVGSDDFNQQLSEHRAGAVRDYFVQQSISADSIAAKGLGKSTPVATNDTAEGRQQNRRVELILSGDAIGVNTANSTATPASTTAQPK